MKPATAQLFIDLFRLLLSRSDEQSLRIKAAELTLYAYPEMKEAYARHFARLQDDPPANGEMSELLERLQVALTKEEV